MAKKLDFSSLNLQDALDLAILVEEEAQERYVELANQIGSSTTGDAGAFFVQMAENEAKHGRELAAQRTKLFGNAKTTVTAEMIDHIRDVEAPDYDQARSFMSERHALEIALGCETKAYNFFDKALAEIKNEEVKNLFIELKAEEVHHQDLLKDLIKKSSDNMNPEVDPDDVDEPSGL
jgi:rubrerythrin